MISGMNSFWSFLGAIATGGVLLWLLQQAEKAWSRRQKLKAEKDRLLRIMVGLPDEMKAVLAAYHLQGAHTLRLDPTHSQVAQLVRLGLLAPGEGAGTYAAICRWVVLKEPFWNLLGEWLAQDFRAQTILEEIRQELEERHE